MASFLFMYKWYLGSLSNSRVNGVNSRVNASNSKSTYLYRNNFVSKCPKLELTGHNRNEYRKNPFNRI